LILLFNQVFSQPVIQQDPYLKFDHLTKKEGLSNNFVLDIYQDKYGFIWIGTKNGILWIETSEGTLHKYDIAKDSLLKHKHRQPKMINTYFYHKNF